MGDQIYISTSAFQTDILVDAGEAALKSIRKIEFTGGKHIGYKRTVAGIEGLLRNGVTDVLIHNYFPAPEESFVLNFASEAPAIRERSFSLAEKAISLCARFGAPYYSFHPGYLDDGYERADGHFAFSSRGFAPYQKALARFRESVLQLLEMGKAKGVAIAVENLFPAPGNVQTSLNCSMGQVDELLSALPDEVGLLVDLGHLNVTAHYLKVDKSRFVDFLLSRFASRIYEVHVSGNCGAADEHLPIFFGDWQLTVLKAFTRCPGFSGKGVNITLEARRLDPDTLYKTRALVERHL